MYLFSRISYLQFSDNIHSRPLSNQHNHLPLPRRPYISILKLHFSHTKWKPSILIKALPTGRIFLHHCPLEPPQKDDIDNGSLFSASADILSQPVCEAHLRLSASISRREFLMGPLAWVVGENLVQQRQVPWESGPSYHAMFLGLLDLLDLTLNVPFFTIQLIVIEPAHT